MKFEIPKVTRFLPLQEYAPEEKNLAGVGIHIWVDPPSAVLAEFDELNRAYMQVLNELGAGKKSPNGGAARPAKPISMAERLLGWLKLIGKREQDSRFKTATESYRRSINTWYARLWSQSKDVQTHWTIDELERISDKNPQLYEWLCVSSWSLIEQHRADVKKGCRGPLVSLPAAERPATPSSAPI
jgi:hypothetical protein